MLPRHPFARRLWGASAVLLASLVSVLAVRGHQKANPYAPDAPAYRQKGGAGAPIVIVEFSDFQCPACRYAVSPVKSLLSLYGGQTRLIFKHFPLRQHRLAPKAAAAAECAGRQGRFWDFHDLLYDKQEAWVKVAYGKDTDWAKAQSEAVAYYEERAGAMGLDRAAFAACLNDPASAALVERDLKDGNDHWILSTPTFFINGKRFVGSQQLTESGIPWIDRILKERK